MAAVQTPQQYKQSSRKGKKAWRKNVDISDVQEGLENLREEELKGGVISEKPSTDLFSLDTSGSSQIRKTYGKSHKPLKADEILAQRSAIPAISGRKRGNENAKVTDGIMDPRNKKRKTDWVSHRELERLKSIAYRAQPVFTDPSTEDAAADHDPWAVKAPASEKIMTGFDYLEPAKPRVAPKTIKEPPIAQTVNGKPIRAVPNPKAGISYNPVFRDWDELLFAEGQKEVAAETSRLEEEAEEKERLQRIAAEEDEECDEMSGGDDESAWEGIESEYEGQVLLKKKRPERKTPAQRNKIARRKERERAEKWQRKMKERRRQTEKVREISAAIEAHAKQKALSSLRDQEDSSSEGDDTALRRHPFGKAPIPAKPLEVVLPDELKDSLRLFKPELNALTDRFRNWLMQGKLESRKRISQRERRKTTVTEKWGYKDWKLR